jgi:RNA polymerase sigma-70 factor (ECF subfamily)
VARDEILSRLRERIVGFAASRIGRDLAEDLAQEVLLVIENRYAHIESLDDLLPLSLRILRFKMMAARRKAIRRGEHTAIDAEEAALADQGPSPEVWAENREVLDLLKVAVGKLGVRCREILRLKLLGRNFSEIQEELGASSINTVYTWDSRCREQLLKLMGGRWNRK